MQNNFKDACAKLDCPKVLQYLFHPRPEMSSEASVGADPVIRIPVDETVTIGARFYISKPEAPNLLFFHGNGEIVADYDDIAMLYTRMGINFFPVDYRGYGLSGGSPTIVDMLEDAHRIWAFVAAWLEKKSCSGPVYVMGRSLGSAPALELAGAYPEEMAGLIIESGFAYTLPLLRLIGVPVDRLGIAEENGIGNLEKMKSIHIPVRIIHAELDHIIPYSDGEALYEACPASDKQIVRIDGADHNTIFYYGQSVYLQTLADFMR